MKPLPFWIEYGSIYLSVARVSRLADARGVTVDWRPFFVMPIFVQRLAVGYGCRSRGRRTIR